MKLTATLNMEVTWIINSQIKYILNEKRDSRPKIYAKVHKSKASGGTEVKTVH